MFIVESDATLNKDYLLLSYLNVLFGHIFVARKLKQLFFTIE